MVVQNIVQYNFNFICRLKSLKTAYNFVQSTNVVHLQGAPTMFVQKTGYLTLILSILCVRKFHIRKLKTALVCKVLLSLFLLSNCLFSLICGGVGACSTKTQ